MVLLKESDTGPVRILYLCVSNAARSQMAEGLARALLPAAVTVESPGSEPGTLNPYAMAAMAEIGIDISKHQPKGLDAVDLAGADVIVTLCADEICPVEQAADAVRDSVQRRRHQLQLRIPQDLEMVGDCVRLVQIMTNLLTNAVRYTPDGGSIAVEACSLGSIVELRVRDSGVGIDPDLVSRLFDPFVQGPGGHRAGLGVVLNLVQRLVVAHGGSIRVCSEGPGCGSEFRVQLPAAGAAWEEPRPPVTAVS